MSYSSYNPQEIAVIIGGIPIEGLADGTFVNVERSANTFEKSTGCDNRTTRIKQNDRSGTVTITLSQTSPSNDYLSGIMALDEATGDGVVALLIKDINGSTLCSAPYAWIVKPSPAGYGKSITNREWKLDCSDLYMFIGGNPTGV